MTPRFKPYRKDYGQSQLFATNVFDLLPEDHECFLYQELFDQLDTSEIASTHIYAIPTRTSIENPLFSAYTISDHYVGSFATICVPRAGMPCQTDLSMNSLHSIMLRLLQDIK